jgi:outer membrane protein
MKRGITIVFSLFVVCFLASSAYAEKIAFVDVGKVFDGYTKTKDFDATLTTEGKKKQKERDNMVQDIRRLKDEMALLSESSKGEKQAAIDGKIRDLQDFDGRVQRDLGGRRDTVVKEIFNDIDQVVKDYGKQKGYDYVLNNRLVLYSNGQFDITNDILADINKGYKTKK